VEHGAGAAAARRNARRVASGGPLAAETEPGYPTLRMRLLAANHSSLPPPPERGPGSPRMPEDLRRAIQLQQEAGLDVVTDGQTGWSEGASRLLHGVQGVRFAAPSRSGTTMEAPEAVIEGKLRPCGAHLAAAYRRAAEVSAVTVKAVLPGPYSLARRCRIATTAYADVAALARDLSVVLAEEIRELVRAGARIVQVDEPEILHFPGDVRLLREVLEPLHVACRDALLFVSTFGGDAAPLYAQLGSLPGEGIALDCAAADGVVEAIAAAGSGKVLALGLVDGGRAAVENVAALVETIARVRHRYVHESLYLQPSCGMSGLPWEVARRKLEVLVEARRRCAER
jgi:5-methyltetrahydropteroyltriglutamate--homocysteine methyltransferase